MCVCVTLFFFLHVLPSHCPRVYVIIITPRFFSQMSTNKSLSIPLLLPSSSLLQLSQKTAPAETPTNVQRWWSSARPQSDKIKALMGRATRPVSHTRPSKGSKRSPCQTQAGFVFVVLPTVVTSIKSGLIEQRRWVIRKIGLGKLVKRRVGGHC